MIEDSEYSIVVAIPDHVLSDLKDPPKPFLVKFKSKEEKAIYITQEAKSTKHALQTLAGAWTKQERANAFLALYKARSSFCDKFLRDELARLKGETNSPDAA